MTARRALLEDTVSNVSELTAPRRAMLPSITEMAVEPTARPQIQATKLHAIASPAVQATATKRRNRKRARMIVPAAAVTLTSALGVMASFTPASAAQDDQLEAQPSASSSAVEFASTDDATVSDLSFTPASAAQATKKRMTRKQEAIDQQKAPRDELNSTISRAGQLAARQLSSEQAPAKAAEEAAAQQAAATTTVDTDTTEVTTTSTTTTSTSSSSSTTTADTTTTTTSSTASSSAAQTAVSFALSQVGKDYATGGVGPDAYDCSGLMMTAYAQAGVSLPRVTYSQATVGTAVSQSDLQPGDLVFFYGNEHVGMYIGNGQIVHAADYGEGVKISSISYMGGSPSAIRRVA